MLTFSTDPTGGNQICPLKNKKNKEIEIKLFYQPLVKLDK